MTEAATETATGVIDVTGAADAGPDRDRSQLLAALTHDTLAEIVAATADPTDDDAWLRTAEHDLVTADDTPERLLRLLVAHSADMLLVITAEGIVLFASPSVERTLGHDPRDLIGRDIFEFVNADDSALVSELFEAGIEENPATDVFLASVTDSFGHKRWVEALTVGLLDEPAISGFVITLRDVTDRIEAEERAETERLRFRALVDSMPDVVVRLDLDLRPTYGNAAAHQLDTTWLGRGAGKPRLFAEQAAPSARATRELTAVLTTGESRTFETAVRTRSGDIWLSSIAVPERNHRGEIIGILVVTRDVTVYRARTEELTRRALQDPLTGLANRSRLEAELARALHGMAETGAPVGILFADLDGFKDINDVHGHAVGDKLLQLFSRRVIEGLRPSDLVSRFGGDEFVVLPNRLHIAAELESLAERLHQTVTEPFEIDGNQLAVSLSIGIAVTTPSQATPAEELLRRADQAMYVSKRQGRDQTTRWTPAMAPKSPRRR